jgi:hypothetical protein
MASLLTIFFYPLLEKIPKTDEVKGMIAEFKSQAELTGTLHTSR